jgi:hypothetical protein
MSTLFRILGLSKLKKEKIMSKSLLGISIDVVNGIWSVGSETYKVVKDEVNNAIDNEAEIRTRKVLGRGSEDSREFERLYTLERKKVEKEAKELVLKGGLLAVGVGLFF